MPVSIMPTGADSRFGTAVKSALEALLSDLQHTTEILKRSNLSYRHLEQQRDLEPIYQEQDIKTLSVHHGLDNIEQMLDDYSDKRSLVDKHPVPLPRHRDRPSIHSLFSELEPDSSKKSAQDGSSYGYGSSRELRTSPRDPQLDSMMITLDDNMLKHGISTIPKGDCASCRKPIVGEVVIALGKMWHPEHFLCSQCGEELGHRNFFERGGKAYCETDYHDMFSPRCAYCNGPIIDRCVTAMGKTFHSEHFICDECGGQFGDDGFHERDGRAYCKEDFFRMFAPRCKGCRNPIQNSFVTALGTHWHPECFVCQECHKPFDLGSFYDHIGVPLCETHYHEKRGSLCASCHNPISGRCVSAMGQKFHPEHFCCSYCQRQLNKGTFKEVDRKPFCHKCFQMVHA